MRRPRCGKCHCILPSSKVEAHRRPELCQCRYHSQYHEIHVARKAAGLCLDRSCKNKRGRERFCDAHLAKFRAKELQRRGYDQATVWADQGGKCALTGRLLVKGVNAVFERIVGPGLGGKAERSNVRWVIRSVNTLRRGMPDDEFLALCRDVVGHSDRFFR